MERMIWRRWREEQSQRGHRHGCLRKWVKISQATPSFMTSEQHAQTHAVKTRCFFFSPHIRFSLFKWIHLRRQRSFAHTQEWVSVCQQGQVRSYTLPQIAAKGSSCGRTMVSPRESVLHPHHIWWFWVLLSVKLSFKYGVYVQWVLEKKKAFQNKFYCFPYPGWPARSLAFMLSAIFSCAKCCCLHEGIIYWLWNTFPW